jgi:hypothetical protein
VRGDSNTTATLAQATADAAARRIAVRVSFLVIEDEEATRRRPEQAGRGFPA